MMRVVIAVVILALTASAAADRKKAEKLFRSGEKAYKAQNFLAAAQHFELAYHELPAPEIAFSAAQAYRRQYRVDSTHPEYVDKAIRYYELYLKERKTGGRVGDAADSLGEMLRERSRLGEGKSGSDDLEKKTLLGVSVGFADEQDASTKVREVDEDKPASPARKVSLTIDGTPHEPDMLHPVEPGERVIRAEAEGYEPAERRVRVIAGAQQPEELVLQPLPAHITVTTEPGATVIVDGRGVGEAPVAPIAVPAGSHVITVIRAGRRAQGREVIVERAQKIAVEIPLEATLRRRSVKWVAVGSVAFAGLAGFAALGALYWDDQAAGYLAALERGDQDLQVLEDYVETRANRDRAKIGIWVAGGTAIAVGLTAAWLYYFDSPSAEGVRVIPAATGNSAGAVISGRF